MSTVDTQELLGRVASCVQAGKADVNTNIPAGSKGQPGVAELVDQLLAAKVPAQTVLEKGLLAGMQVIGKKFAANEVFIPEVLISARAMKAGMGKLRQAFTEEQIRIRGVFIIGSVKGDLHDIGKNLVGMIMEGAGWKIVDLGVDCAAEKYLAAVSANPGCAVGLSALLTTTMVNMREIVTAIHKQSPNTVVLIGGAPVTQDFAKEIGANGYAPDPASAVDILNRLKPAA